MQKYRLFSDQTFYNVPGHHQTGTGRNPGQRTGNTPTAGRRFFKLQRRGRFLLAVENGVMENTAVSKLLAHDSGEMAALGFGDVRNFKLGWIQLVSGAHGADHGNAALHGGLNQAQFAGDQINGIYDKVTGLPEESFLVFFVVQLRDRDDAAVRINIPDSFRHYIGLPEADCGMQGTELPIDIGYGNGIVVNQGQGADACAGKPLGSIAAYAANPKDHDMTAA